MRGRSLESTRRDNSNLLDEEPFVLRRQFSPQSVAHFTQHGLDVDSKVVFASFRPQWLPVSPKRVSKGERTRDAADEAYAQIYILHRRSRRRLSWGEARQRSGTIFLTNSSPLNAKDQ